MLVSLCLNVAMDPMIAIREEPASCLDPEREWLRLKLHSFLFFVPTFLLGANRRPCILDMPPPEFWMHGRNIFGL